MPAFARNRCQPGDLQVRSVQQERRMRFKWIIIAVAAVSLAVIVADPALARVKHKAQRLCVDRPYAFSWGGFLTNPAPQPNGCAPAVYEYGMYVGQDPC